MSLFQNMDSSNNILKKDYEENKNTENNKIPFWGTNPNVLFKTEYILEFFPVENMTYEQKLNALTRSIIVLTLFGFILSNSFRLLFISMITLLAIFLLHYYQNRESDKGKNVIEEHFENQGDEVIAKYGISKENVFDKPSSSNPFSNVLITDYEYNPNKKPAPPSFNKNINTTILQEAKQLVSELNPDQPEISDKLFKDLGEQFVFEQSLRQFTSNPSTVIPNDQTGFAEFAYGSMVSCKEGNLFACARNLDRYTNY
jgi:hypothetical protein